MKFLAARIPRLFIEEMRHQATFQVMNRYLSSLVETQTGSLVIENCGQLDRLVPQTRTATTAGGGFPTESQRRWWQLQERR